MRLCPFWVNRVGGLNVESPSALTFADLLHCSVEDPEEMWTHVILTNYIVDLEWIFDVATSLRLPGCRVFIVSGEVGFEGRYLVSSLSNLLGENKVKIIQPKLPIPFGVHHGKLILCVNARGIRISVVTANFTECDWNNKTQGIYVQDFPRLKLSLTESGSGTPPSAQRTHRGMRFRERLKDYLRSIGVITTPPEVECFPSHLIDEVDYSGVCVELLSSVPGFHRGPDAYRFGMGGLQTILRFTELGIPPCEGPPTLTWQFSSQGVLTNSFLRSMERTMTASAVGIPTFCDSRPVVQVVYPTEEEVRCSLEGWRGGLSLPVRLRCCHPYINERLHRWGLRPGVPNIGRGWNRAIPHMKSYTCLTESKDGLRWFVLTSANLSRAAWGDWQKGGNQLLIRSYELGVVYSSVSSVPHVDEVFSITPSKRLPAPVSVEGDGLVRVSIKGGPSSGGAEVVLLLPYNPLSPEPYLSTVEMQRQETEPTTRNNVCTVSNVDVPWVIDFPHSGKDCLGMEFHDLLGDGYSHCEETTVSGVRTCSLRETGSKRVRRNM